MGQHVVPIALLIFLTYVHVPPLDLGSMWVYNVDKVVASGGATMKKNIYKISGEKHHEIDQGTRASG